MVNFDHLVICDTFGTCLGGRLAEGDDEISAGLDLDQDYFHYRKNMYIIIGS